MKLKKRDSRYRDGVLRYGLLVPLVMIIASVTVSVFSYTNAKEGIRADLNEGMFVMVNENSGVWTRQDTIMALRQMQEATHRPMIYRAWDVEFRNAVLKDDVYFTLALVDKNAAASNTGLNIDPAWQASGGLASDSILLVPECETECVAVKIQGFANCSMASVFAASDQTVPGVLFSLSMVMMAGALVWRRKGAGQTESVANMVPSIDGIRLTPMQRRFTQMLLDAPGLKVDKMTLCAALWDNKSNAEESLYTLVRRTKAALADADIEIRCNRGDSYELRVRL